MLTIIAFFVSTVIVSVTVASRIGLWDVGLLKDTVLWALFSGFALVLGAIRDSKSGFFWRRLRESIGIAAFIEFYSNLVVFPLLIELLLQPLLLLISVLRPFATREPRFLPAKRLLDGLAAALGIGVLGWVTVGLVSSIGTFDTVATAKSFALPIWLFLAASPLVFAIELWTQYARASWTMRNVAGSDRAKRRALLAIAIGLNFQVRAIATLDWRWMQSLTAAPDLGSALRVIGRDGARRRIGERLRRQRRELLRRYAGVAGIDEFGRQLDRREFRPTARALDELLTYEGAW
jgi:hypothetical protein